MKTLFNDILMNEYLIITVTIIFLIFMYVYNCLFKWYISPLFLLYLKTEIPIFFQLSYIFFHQKFLDSLK
jgi:hypothetical protein